LCWVVTLTWASAVCVAREAASAAKVWRCIVRGLPVLVFELPCILHAKKAEIY
jgi:hypothetical protein